MEKGHVPSSFLWKIRSDGTKKKKKKRTQLEKKEGTDGKDTESILKIDRIENRKKLTDLLNPQSRLKDVSFLFDSHIPSTKTHIESTKKVEKEDCSVAVRSAHANDIPITKIPPEFFIYESTTVLDSAGDDDEFDEDLMQWRRRIFPSTQPTSRAEVLHLAQVADVLVSHAMKKSHRIISQEARERLQIWDIIFTEVVRQVFVGCTERGVLLDRVRKEYYRIMTGMFEKFDELCIVEENLHKTRAKWETDMNELKGENLMLREKLFNSQKKIDELEIENQNVKILQEKVHERNELLQMQVSRSETLLAELKDMLERQTSENESLKLRVEDAKHTDWSPRSESPEPYIVKRQSGMQCGAPASTMVEDGFQTDEVWVHKEYLDDLKKKEFLEKGIQVRMFALTRSPSIAGVATALMSRRRSYVPAKEKEKEEFGDLLDSPHSPSTLSSSRGIVPHDMTHSSKKNAVETYSIGIQVTMEEKKKKKTTMLHRRKHSLTADSGMKGTPDTFEPVTSSADLHDIPTTEKDMDAQSSSSSAPIPSEHDESGLKYASMEKKQEKEMFDGILEENDDDSEESDEEKSEVEENSFDDVDDANVDGEAKHLIGDEDFPQKRTVSPNLASIPIPTRTSTPSRTAGRKQFKHVSTQTMNEHKDFEVQVEVKVVSRRPKQLVSKRQTQKETEQSSWADSHAASGEFALQSSEDPTDDEECDFVVLMETSCQTEGMTSLQTSRSRSTQWQYEDVADQEDMFVPKKDLPAGFSILDGLNEGDEGEEDDVDDIFLGRSFDQDGGTGRGMTAGTVDVKATHLAQGWVKHRVVRSESGAHLREPVPDFDEGEYVDMLSDETLERDRPKRRIHHALPRRKEVHPQILEKALSNGFPKSYKRRRHGLKWVRGVIWEIYRERMSLNNEQLESLNIMDFIYDFHLFKYGLRTMAEMYLVDFLHSVKDHAVHCQRCDLFTRFVGTSEWATGTSQDLSNESFKFFISFLKVAIPHIHLLPNPEKNDGLLFLKRSELQEFLEIHSETFERSVKISALVGIAKRLPEENGLVNFDHFLSAMMLSHQWEEDERIEELKTVFEEIDDDGDALLSPDEFHDFVQQTVNHEVPQILIWRVFGEALKVSSSADMVDFKSAYKAMDQYNLLKHMHKKKPPSPDPIARRESNASFARRPDIDLLTSAWETVKGFVHSVRLDFHCSSKHTLHTLTHSFTRRFHRESVFWNDMCAMCHKTSLTV
eukprot:TRINITY_DN547_c0_g1_i3.p1 TRINITY_DN547_c0_g1~~TRINITY_DN547_c0_g1_i3.p1  ORF type:complete len:1259 (+),score=415.71 TRINITY_DN547_c0_g1_i3:96-3779(+)